MHSPETLETPSLPAPINTRLAHAEPTLVSISSSSASRAPTGKPAAKAADSPKNSKGFWGGRKQRSPLTAQKAPTAGLVQAVPHRADGVQRSEASQESVQPSLQSDTQAAAEDIGHLNGVEMSDMHAVKAADTTPLSEDANRRELSDSQDEGVASLEEASPCSSDETGQAAETQNGLAEDVSGGAASPSPLDGNDSSEAKAVDAFGVLLQDMPVEGDTKVKYRQDEDVLHNPSGANIGSTDRDVAEEAATTSARAGAAEGRVPVVEGESAAAGNSAPAPAAVHPLAIVQNMPEAETLEEALPAVSRSASGKAQEKPGTAAELTVERGDMSAGPSPVGSKAGSSTSEILSLQDPLQVKRHRQLMHVA